MLISFILWCRPSQRSRGCMVRCVCVIVERKNACIPYLGLVFSSNNPYSRTQSTLADQAIFQLHKTLLSFKDITLLAALYLSDKLMTPILFYGCGVWGFHLEPDIQRVHLSFCKRIMCVKKSLQNVVLYGLLGRFPLELNRQCGIMSYWLKIVTG